MLANESGKQNCQSWASFPHVCLINQEKIFSAGRTDVPMGNIRKIFLVSLSTPVRPHGDAVLGGPGDFAIEWRRHHQTPIHLRLARGFSHRRPVRESTVDLSSTCLRPCCLCHVFRKITPIYLLLKTRVPKSPSRIGACLDMSPCLMRVSSGFSRHPPRLAYPSYRVTHVPPPVENMAISSVIGLSRGKSKSRRASAGAGAAGAAGATAAPREGSAGSNGGGPRPDSAAVTSSSLALGERPSSDPLWAGVRMYNCLSEAVGDVVQVRNKLAAGWLCVSWFRSSPPFSGAFSFFFLFVGRGACIGFHPCGRRTRKSGRTSTCSLRSVPSDVPRGKQKRRQEFHEISSSVCGNKLIFPAQFRLSCVVQSRAFVIGPTPPPPLKLRRNPWDCCGIACRPGFETVIHPLPGGGEV